MVAELLPLITFLGSTAGAGAAASWLFDQLRLAFPKPTVEAWNGLGKAKKTAYRIVWSPQYARHTVFFFAASISVLCTALGALLSGEPFSPLLSACISVWVSQAVHATGLSTHIQRKEVE